MHQLSLAVLAYEDTTDLVLHPFNVQSTLRLFSCWFRGTELEYYPILIYFGAVSKELSLPSTDCLSFLEFSSDVSAGPPDEPVLS